MNIKVLVESYNCVTQNTSGGIQVRIRNFIKNYREHNGEIELFDKWRDKITDYDILHIFKVNIEDFQLINLAKKNNIPVIISTIIPLEKRFNIIANRFICNVLPFHSSYWYINEVLIKADAIITESKRESEFINKYYKIPKEKIFSIPNGVDIDIKEGKENLLFQQKGIVGKYVLQVGRFDRNKNQMNVIRAMSGTGIPIVFIGGEDATNPEYYQECKKIAGDNIYFLGWIDHDDPILESAYLNAQVVIMPSYKETFGISLIEGGAAGANLIASKDLPILDWGISNICQTINPNNTKDIKDKIYDAYRRPLNPQTSIIIKNIFSWDSVVKQHINLYNAIINRGTKL